MPSSGMYIYV